MAQMLLPGLLAWRGSNAMSHGTSVGIMMEASSGIQEAPSTLQAMVGSVHPTDRQLRVPAVRLAGTGKPTVWSEFGELASQTQAVNLGQARARIYVKRTVEL